jgi:adenosylcobinamide kinase/adenosylcobinamide-phosphate guanylyltransferase
MRIASRKMLLSDRRTSQSEEQHDEPEQQADEALNNEVVALLACIKQSTARWIVVSNEVGLGLVPPYPLGRLDRDGLGRANQRLATNADQVILMIAGIPTKISGFYGG